jgi:glycerophosphoryl diester phosphodiesterase
LKSFRQLNKTIPIATLEPSPSNVGGLIFKKKMIDNVISNKFEGIHPLYKLVNKKIVEYAHSNNIFVNPWTADNENDWKSLIDVGVDGITTNNPRGLIEFLNRMK